MTSKTTRSSRVPAPDFAGLTAAAECLKALAHPVRLRMVQLLLSGQYSVAEIADDCQVPQNVASEHLRLMQRCGFLTSRREGRKVFYQVSEAHLSQMMDCIESRFLRSPKPSTKAK